MRASCAQSRTVEFSVTGTKHWGEMVAMDQAGEEGVRQAVKRLLLLCWRLDLV